jgi:hypothetical protein
MAFNDPTDKNLRRMEVRRFLQRCEGQIALIQRADSLREISRLTLLPLPYAVSEDYTARDSLRLVQTAAEDRARELILEQIQGYLKADPMAHEKLRRAMFDSWANLTGALGHLRPWAQSKLTAAQQQAGI